MTHPISKNSILLSVFRSSATVICALVLSICLFLKWHPLMILTALMASLIISVPPVVSLHALLWLVKRMRISRIFAWMLLFASLPLLASLPAFAFASLVPGKAGVLILMGIISGYAALLAQGMPIAQLFNATENENE
jgi:hypothetical protein